MKKILVVDDEEHILTLVELSLKPDFEVSKARNCKETFDSIKKQKPDLVLLDLMLPNVSGFEICKKLKKMDFPVWILSAKGLKDDIKKGMESGADGYITKPFDPEELVNKIKSCFGGD
ncbi:response regulator [Candidatus Woesearchaeota archaeon]|nr:response regulator [Candidatus Woesearchaeota archaeon]